VHLTHSGIYLFFLFLAIEGKVLKLLFSILAYVPVQLKFCYS
jgi:hypothetical protein